MLANHLLLASGGLDKKIVFYDVVEKKYGAMGPWGCLCGRLLFLRPCCYFFLLIIIVSSQRCDLCPCWVIVVLCSLFLILFCFSLLCRVVKMITCEAPVTSLVFMDGVTIAAGSSAGIGSWRREGEERGSGELKRVTGRRKARYCLIFFCFRQYLSVRPASRRISLGCCTGAPPIFCKLLSLSTKQPIFNVNNNSSSSNISFKGTYTVHVVLHSFINITLK